MITRLGVGRVEGHVGHLRLLDVDAVDWSGSSGGGPSRRLAVRGCRSACSAPPGATPGAAPPPPPGAAPGGIRRGPAGGPRALRRPGPPPKPSAGEAPPPPNATGASAPNPLRSPNPAGSPAGPIRPIIPPIPPPSAAGCRLKISSSWPGTRRRTPSRRCRAGPAVLLNLSAPSGLAWNLYSTLWAGPEPAARKPPPAGRAGVGPARAPGTRPDPGGAAFGPLPGGGPPPAPGGAAEPLGLGRPRILRPDRRHRQAPHEDRGRQQFRLAHHVPPSPRGRVRDTVVDTPDPGPTRAGSTTVPLANSAADSGAASIPPPATPANPAAPVSPRRVIASASACFALHTRPDTVPIFHPSRRAASPCRTPCRTHSTNGTRRASGSRSISA